MYSITNKKSASVIYNYYSVGHHKHPYELLFITPSHTNIFKSPSELNSVNKRIFAIHAVTSYRTIRDINKVRQ